MLSTTNSLLNRLSSKFSSLSQVPDRLRQKYKPSHADNLPITRSSLPLHCEQRRKLARDETNGLYTQAQWVVETAPAPAADATMGTSSEDEACSWHDSKTGATSGTDLSARYGNEDWRQDWEPIKMLLQQGAQRRVVITTVDRRQDGELGTKHDSGYCDYDYSAVIRALEATDQPEPEREPEEDEGCGAETFLVRAREDFEKAKREMRMVASKVEFGGQVRQLRQTVLVGNDDEGEEIVYFREGWRTSGDGKLVCGDAWWKYS